MVNKRLTGGTNGLQPLCKRGFEGKCHRARPEHNALSFDASFCSILGMGALQAASYAKARVVTVGFDIRPISGAVSRR